ncbi:MAG: carboxylesterase [Zetaproteobacteria bacterium]|nr:MAG: carboxylesterase [Zetaproteobacteria bacterium]
MPFPPILPAVRCETGTHPPDAAVIWLHGLGADGHDFEPVIGQLELADLAVRFVLPHAPAMPVTVNGGYIMPAWYDIRSSDLTAEVDAAGIDRAADAIDRLVEREAMRGIEPRRILLAGFSQGAVVALRCGLRKPHAIGGIIALSGYLPFAVEQADAEAPPLFLGHGIHDTIVPFALGDRARRLLQDAGYRVSWHSWPIDHGVCPEEIAGIGRWIRRRLQQETKQP